MLKKLTVLGITLLITSILVKSSEAVYFRSEEGLALQRNEEAENYGKMHPDIFLPQDQTIDIIRKTEKKVLEERDRRIYSWWKIAEMEWGTVGIPTVGYFLTIDYNIGKFPLASAVILTPFLMKAAAVSVSEVEKDKMEQAEEETEIVPWEMGTKQGELSGSCSWLFHIPFIIWSSDKLPGEIRFILRFYPKEREPKEVESVFSFDRESKIGEDVNAGFFHYVAFPAEEFFREVSFSEDGTELKGNITLILITQVGEEVIFPFDLSKMR